MLFCTENWATLVLNQLNRWVRCCSAERRRTLYKKRWCRWAVRPLTITLTQLAVFIGRWQNQDRTGSDRIGPDRIGSDGTAKIWIGSDRTHKTWIGSSSIKETHIYSLKVGAFQIPTKNGQVVSLDQYEEERSRKWLPVHCFCFFSSILPWRLFVYCYAYGFTPCKVLHEKNFFLEGEI